ncbi:degenerin mec-10-like [Hydractinia symbiolongicarpus]|uniref:degenerin mec-10-like n=1 Tax=Hydractinia symbiolongicarpus TaxID=13093 RepID=UPI00254B989A|nr:degenerin mec-10-like [Hydractinia symbiolongicarpus]
MYLQKETSSKVFLQEEKSLKFPEVLICNLNPIKDKMIEKFLRQGNEAHVELFKKNWSSLEYLHYALVRKIGLDSFQSNYSNNMRVRCDWMGKNCSYLAENYFDIYHGNCINLNLDKLNIEVTNKGLHQSAKLSIEAPYSSKFHEYNISHFRGIQILIQETETLYYPFADGYTLSAGFRHNIALKKSLIKRIDRFGNNTCMKESWVKEKSFSFELPESLFFHDKFFCQELCTIDDEVKQCGCSKTAEILLVNASLLCKINNTCIHNVNYDAKCLHQCTPPCYETNYNLDISSYIANDYQSSNSMDIVNLQIFYRDMRTEIWEETQKFGLLHYICEIGGLLGLLSGYSAITLCEVAGLLFTLCGYCAVNCNRKTRKTSNNMQTEKIPDESMPDEKIPDECE